MVDLRREGNNNRFREIEVVVSEAHATVDQTTATLPVCGYAVTNARLDVIKADSTSGATMDVKVNGTVVNDEVPVDSTGFNTGTLKPAVFNTGGDITIEAGSTAPAGDGIIRLVLEVVAMDAREGDYIS